MAHYATGAFYGYREEERAYIRPPGLPPRASLSPIKLDPVLMEGLGIPCYDYRAFNGEAPAEYETWTVLPWACRMVKWMLDGGPIEVQISYDGTEIGDTRIIRSSVTTLDSFVGFRVRELIPGLGTWYQCIPML